MAKTVLYRPKDGIEDWPEPYALKFLVAREPYEALFIYADPWATADKRKQYSPRLPDCQDTRCRAAWQPTTSILSSPPPSLKPAHGKHMGAIPGLIPSFQCLSCVDNRVYNCPKMECVSLDYSSLGPR